MQGARIVFSGWLALLVAGAYGEQYAFVGARATGMGGANAASTRDSSAIWQNPAAFGFMGSEQWASNAVDNGNLASRDFSWNLFGIGAGYTATEDMGRYLDILADIDFGTFDQGSLSASSQNVDALLSMAGIIGSLDTEDALYFDMTAGTSIQIGHLGIGLRLFGEGAAWSVPDKVNLALDNYADTAALVSEIDDAASNESFSWNGTYNLSSQQRSDLATVLGGIDPNGGTVQYLDAQFGNLAASGDLTPSEINAAIDLFNALDPSGSAGSIDDNTSAVIGRAFSLMEVPVSYGWALDENWSVGVTAKAMYGSVLGTKLWIFDDNNDQVLEDASDNSESSLNIGLDLGMLYRMPNFQFALVGHNLNRPTFSGFDETISYTINGGATQTEAIRVPDVKLDPQMVLGMAFMPSQRLTLEANLDLLEVGTVLPGYDVQRISFGGEIDVWLVALRLGVYRNLAESWQDWVAAAGVGADLAGIRVDIGGALSLGKDVEYDGNDIPSEARLYAGIGLDF